MTNLEALIEEKEERGRAYEELCRQADEQARTYLDHVRRLEEEVVRLAAKLADAEAELAWRRISAGVPPAHDPNGDPT